MNTSERRKAREFTAEFWLSVGLLATSLYLFKTGTSDDYPRQYPIPQQTTSINPSFYEVSGLNGAIIMYCRGGTYQECYDVAYPPPPRPPHSGNEHNVVPIGVEINISNLNMQTAHSGRS